MRRQGVPAAALPHLQLTPTMQRIRPRELLLLLALVLGIAGPPCLDHASAAPTFTGRAGLWSYVRDDSVDHVQIVPLLSLNVQRLGCSEDWAIETTFRGFADYQNGATNGSTRLRANRAVLIWKPEGTGWELRGGQQWVNEGIGRGNVVGLWSRHEFSRKTDLRAYVGARLPNTLRLDEAIPETGMTGGLNFRTKFGPRQIGLSYFYVGDDARVLFSGLGFDYFCASLTDVTLRARLHMNLEQEAIETGQLSVYWQTNDKLLISAEARTQTPRIFEDSFFSIFLDEAKTNTVRGGAEYEFYKHFFATGMGYLVFTEEDMLYKSRLGLGCRKIEVGYTHWLSAGKGDMDGFYGEIKHGCKSLDGYAGFDYARGSNSEIRPNSEDQVIFAGLDWSPKSYFTIGARGEHLKDSEHSEDFRALFSLMTTFKSGVRSGS